MSIQHLAKQIHAEILRAQNILLVSHKNPDGDAVGCLTAFSHYLDSLSKTSWMFCSDVEDVKQKHLLKAQDILGTVKDILAEDISLIIFFDCSDLEHAHFTDELKNFKNKPRIINIDHHATNEGYGDINLVVPDAASTTEIVNDYFSETQTTVNNEIATCLLNGIISDTDTFLNHNTTPKSIETASRLLGRGGHLTKITRWLYKNKDISTLKQWGGALQRLFIQKEYNVGITVITKDEISTQQQQEQIEGLSNYLNRLSDVRFTLVLKELPDGHIKGSFRTSNDLIDVSKLAKILGGGGHKKAAGFTISGSLQETSDGWKVV